MSFQSKKSVISNFEEVVKYVIAFIIASHSIKIIYCFLDMFSIILICNIYLLFSYSNFNLSQVNNLGQLGKIYAEYR